MKRMKWLPVAVIVLLAGMVCASCASTPDVADKADKVADLRKKALDAVEIQTQLIKGKEGLTAVEAFLVNKETFTVDDLYTLFEWATSEERGDDVYSFADVFGSASRMSDARERFGFMYIYTRIDSAEYLPNGKTQYRYTSDGFKMNFHADRDGTGTESGSFMILCNAMSELCGLTPVYWAIPKDSSKGLSPIRSKINNYELLGSRLYAMPNADGFRMPNGEELYAAGHYPKIIRRSVASAYEKIYTGYETLFLVRNIPNVTNEE